MHPGFTSCSLHARMPWELLCSPSLSAPQRLALALLAAILLVHSCRAHVELSQKPSSSTWRAAEPPKGLRARLKLPTKGSGEGSWPGCRAGESCATAEAECIFLLGGVRASFGPPACVRISVLPYEVAGPGCR